MTSLSVLSNRWIAGCLLALLCCTGCATQYRLPNLRGLYGKSAKLHDVDRHPVIVIPGILGSKLKDAQTGQVVWGAFAGGYANPKRAQGARLFALPMREGAKLRDLKDGVVPNGALEKLKLKFLGMPIELSAYVHLIGALGAGGYRDQPLGESGAIDYGEDHFTCFQFAYDWRRDTVENAQRLHAFILGRQAYVQAELERRFGKMDRQVKFDIVAHSMGGLLTRYYLRYGAAELPEDGSVPPVTWAGTEHVRRVILVGTPNAGSVKTVDNLVEGIKFGPFLPKYEAALLGTFPSIYQLLPRAQHHVLVDAADSSRALDPLDPELWEQMQWGLADPKQDRVLKTLLPDVADPAVRRRIAIDHQRKSLLRARQLAQALDQPAPLPKELSLHLFAGDAIPTDAVLAVDSEDGSLQVHQTEPGDGTVTRSSALMDERSEENWSRELISPIDWTNVTFLFTGHRGMTSDPAFIDNILFFLLEKPTEKS